MLFVKETVSSPRCRSIPSFMGEVRCGLGFPGDSVVKNPPASAGARDSASVPGSGRSAAGGDGSPLQYSCLGNLMDRGAWRATVHGVSESNAT